jgi:hypothetical protein
MVLQFFYGFKDVLKIINGENAPRISTEIRENMKVGAFLSRPLNFINISA